MKLKTKKKKNEVTFDNSYMKVAKDYTNLKKYIKYTCVLLVIFIFALATKKALSNDTTEVDAALMKVDKYLNKVDKNDLDSLRAFAMSFTHAYMSSDDNQNKKNIIEKYISANLNGFAVNFKGNTKLKVLSTYINKVDEISDELVNVSVFTRTEVSVSEINEVTNEEKLIKKYKDYILKIPIFITKNEDGNFLYSIYKAPSFEPLTDKGGFYQGKFIKLSQLSKIKTSKMEETIMSFLKVYFEGTDSEIKYFYIGSDEINGFKGEFNLISVDKTDIYEIEGSDELIGYSKITTEDEFGSTYKNDYEFVLREIEGKWFIKEFGVKVPSITVLENEEE